MRDKRLAICIPTYNRAAIIEEMLAKSLENYTKRDWDLYIYDSSTDNNTRIIVEKYMKKYSGLFYKYIDSSVHSNLKVYFVFEEFGNAQEYEYVWIGTDTFTWSETLLDVVRHNLDLNYDLLIVNYRDVDKIGTREFTDYNDLFVNCAWHMTYYGATIYKTKTMLQEVPWEYLKERYCIPERINFSHVAYCFEKICTMPQFTAKHLSFHSKHLYVSPMKKNVIAYKKETFYIFCECWPSMIMALPDCYHNKELAIQKHGINSGMFLDKYLIELREEGIYTYDIYKKYENIWQMLTNVSKKRLKVISLFPKKWVRMLQFKYYYNLKRTKKKIVKFAKRHSQLYLYGCGAKATFFAQYLQENNIAFQGFIVTALDQEKSTFMDKKVLQFKPDILSDPKVGLIMALGRVNTQEVMDMIKKTNIKPRCGIFLDQI